MFKGTLGTHYSLVVKADTDSPARTVSRRQRHPYAQKELPWFQRYKNYCKLLDEKFCDVIVKRYIEQVGTTENVYVMRDGQKIKFDDFEVNADEQ